MLLFKGTDRKTETVYQVADLLGCGGRRGVGLAGCGGGLLRYLSGVGPGCSGLHVKSGRSVNIGNGIVDGRCEMQKNGRKRLRRGCRRFLTFEEVLIFVVLKPPPRLLEV